VDVAQLRARLGTFHELPTEDPALLHAQIRSLQAEIATLRRQLTTRPAPERIVERVVVPAVSADQQAQLETLVRQLQGFATTVQTVGATLIAGLAQISDGGSPLPSAEIARPIPLPPAAILPDPLPPPATPHDAPPVADLDLSGWVAGKRKLLATLAHYAPLTLTRVQLYTLAGYSTNSGSTDGNLQALKKEGLVQETAKQLAITPAGWTRLGRTPPAPPLTAAATVALWHQVLDPGPWRVLNTLIGIYPAGLTRDELADQAGFSRTSGTFGGYISLLRQNGLVQVHNGRLQAGSLLRLAEEPRSPAVAAD